MSDSWTGYSRSAVIAISESSWTQPTWRELGYAAFRRDLRRMSRFSVFKRSRIFLRQIPEWSASASAPWMRLYGNGVGLESTRIPIQEQSLPERIAGDMTWNRSASSTTGIQSWRLWALWD